jgi:hypothetical protein
MADKAGISKMRQNRHRFIVHAPLLTSSFHQDKHDDKRLIQV